MTRVFHAITGTRQKTSWRQVMGILPTPVMMGMANPTIDTYALAVTTPPASVESKPQAPAVPETVLPM